METRKGRGFLVLRFRSGIKPSRFIEEMESALPRSPRKGSLLRELESLRKGLMKTNEGAFLRAKGDDLFSKARVSQNVAHLPQEKPSRSQHM